jgi:hypothetical protein
MHMMIVTAAFALVAVTPFLAAPSAGNDPAAYSDEAPTQIDESDEAERD